MGELVTASMLNTHVRDNLNELRAGGLAISGQATNRIPYASSSTQLATSANLTFDGTAAITVGSGTAQWKTGVVSAETYLYGYNGTQKMLRHGNGYNYTFSGGATGWGVLNAAETVVLISVSDGGVFTANGASALLGNVQLGSTNITDGVGTPTIASGFGSSPTIAGKSFAFIVTIGSGGGITNGTVNFGTTYASAPVVVASRAAGSADPVLVGTVTTTQVSLSAGNFNNGELIYVLVRGF